MKVPATKVGSSREVKSITQHRSKMTRTEKYEALYNQGLPLIKLQRGQKEPIGGQKYKGVTTRTNWGDLNFGKNDNAGIITGHISGIIVLDIDYKERFPKELDIPETYTVRTKKGYHHYFKLPEDDKDYRCRSRGDDGFDIRANGGYIVAPGSSVAGWKYKVINDADMAEAPEWLLKISREEQKVKSRYRPLAKVELLSLEPPKAETIEKFDTLLSRSTPKGKRSELVWHVIGELVNDGLTNKEIIALFEAYPDGVGKKYFETGGGRVSWLEIQIEKMRDEQERLLVDPFKAGNQTWVEMLHDDIMTTFRSEYGLSVPSEQEEALRQVCDLFISQLDQEKGDWFCIPLGVASGKTEAIKHLIKLLYHHDTERKYSISLSLEKISEIEDIEEWLLDHGVPHSYFQVVHHKVPDLDRVFKKLPDTPVIIHTHYKLRGTSYLSEYFQYKRKQRDLLIFDESMVSSSTFAGVAETVASEINGFLRRYDTDPELRDKIPEEIHQFFKEIEADAKRKEKELNQGTRIGPVEVSIPDHLLSHYELPDLIKYANVIDSKGDIFRDLLLLGKSDKKLRDIFIQKEDSGVVLFTFREIMSPTIKSLITTDASREFRTLFNFSQKPVKIYNVKNFKDYSKLTIKGVALSGSKEKIKRAFETKEEPNPYLDYVGDIVEREKHNHEKILIFHSKQIPGAEATIKLHLVTEKILRYDELGRLQFETFGRENATDRYKDCGCVIFLGLHYKPKFAIKNLIYGEQKGKSPVGSWMMSEVESGEIVMQLQQGSGRGTIRDDKEQVVYFCSYDPSQLLIRLSKVFPSADLGVHCIPDSSLVKAA